MFDHLTGLNAEPPVIRGSGFSLNFDLVEVAAKEELPNGAVCYAATRNKSI